jgi:RNA polymerase sigma-70 factor (ECF subfamily)
MCGAALRMTAPAEAAAGPVRSSSELDELTVAACRRGDRAALERFVRHHERAVFALIARMLGRGPQVDDLAQETFLRACGAIGRFNPQGPARLSTWVLTIASRLCLDQLRSRRSFVAVPDLPHGETPERARESSELGEAIERAAQTLPADQRLCFLLVDVHGGCCDEVAEALQIPAATARTRLFRARTRLRALLSAFVGEAP